MSSFVVKIGKSFAFHHGICGAETPTTGLSGHHRWRALRYPSSSFEHQSLLRVQQAPGAAIGTKLHCVGEVKGYTGW